MMAFQNLKSIAAGQRGVTLVATAPFEMFAEIFWEWKSIPGYGVRISEQGICKELWIANEFIDWVHYRETGNYQPVKFLELKPVPPVEVPIWLTE